jgi:hypothetical protein
MQQLFFSRRPIFSSVRWPIKILERIQYFGRLRKPTKLTTSFCRSSRPTKQTVSFSSAALADENMVCIFIGLVGRRKEMYFHRLPTKMRSFSSILFRRKNIYIFDGFLAIFDDGF